MVPRPVLLVIAIVPVAAVTAAYLVGVKSGVLPRCIPFIDGCTSISATGRNPPGSYLFKPVFLVQSGLLLWAWFSVAGNLGNRLTEPRRALARTIQVAAVIASAALVIYTLTLGSKIPLYEFMRRFGIYFFFIGTVLCQICLTVELARCGLRARPAVLAMSVLVAAPFLLGVANLFLKATLDDPDRWENRIEWCVALLMQLWFVGLYAALEKQAFDRRLRSG